MTITIATSTVAQILTQSNFVDAINGIKYSNLSIARLNTITQTRLLIKGMIYVAQGYNLNQNLVLDNRVEFFTEMVESSMNKLQKLETMLYTVSDEVNDEIGDLKVYYLDQYNNVY